MKQILVYSDSLSWGIIPLTRDRLDFDQRWPGILENTLNSIGIKVRVIEDCLNGRRTKWDDPIKKGRNGLEGISQRIEISSPLALVILMLGTNDFQSMHENSILDSAEGIGALISEIRKAPLEPGMPTPEIFVIAPPSIRIPKGAIAGKFENAEIKSIGIGAAYEEVCKKMKCFYINADVITESSLIDGVHLDVDQHAKLGIAIANAVKNIFGTLIVPSTF